LFRNAVALWEGYCCLIGSDIINKDVEITQCKTNGPMWIYKFSVIVVSRMVWNFEITSSKICFTLKDKGPTLKEQTLKK